MKTGDFLKNIIIIGAIALGKEVVALLEDNNCVKREWNILGFVDDYLEEGSEFFGYPILGNVDWLLAYPEPICAVLGIGSPNFREAMVQRLDSSPHSILFPPIISHSATILSPSTVKIQEGTVVCAECVLTTDISVGRFSLLNLRSTIAHDVVIGEQANLSPNCSVMGRVTVGAKTTIGTGAIVIPNKQIGNHATIGAGTVVISHIPPYATAVGNPARILNKKNNESSDMMTNIMNLPPPPRNNLIFATFFLVFIITERG